MGNSGVSIFWCPVYVGQAGQRPEVVYIGADAPASSVQLVTTIHCSFLSLLYPTLT